MVKREEKLVVTLLMSFLFIGYSLLAKDHSTPGNLGLKELSQFITTKMEEWKVPGLAIAIIKDGKVIFSGGFGFRDVKKKLKVTPKTLFPIGSTTKAFTAAAAGILVDKGILDWDKPIKEYLPWFRLKDSFASQRITILDLLCHRSGLPRHDAVWINSSATRKQLVESLQYLDPSKDFRTTFQYQNLMYMTAGFLMGQLTHSTWEDFLQKEVLEPLNMTDTNFSIEDMRKTSNFALPYIERNGELISIPFRDYTLIGPAGSINSNVMDMARWIILNLNNGAYGEKRIISSKTLQFIHSPHMTITGSFEYEEYFYTSYGMGWFITAYRGHLVLWHGGGAEGFTATVSLMPRDKIGIVTLSNVHQTRLNSIIGYYIYDRLLEFPPISWEQRIKEKISKARNKSEKTRIENDINRKNKTKVSHPIEEYCGDYKNPGYGIISIKKKENHLEFIYNSLTFPLRHEYNDRFIIKSFNLEVSFFSDKKGNINRLSANLEPAVKAIVFIRVDSSH